jgi:hypothetical protein
MFLGFDFFFYAVHRGLRGSSSNAAFLDAGIGGWRRGRGGGNGGGGGGRISVCVCLHARTLTRARAHTHTDGNFDRGMFCLLSWNVLFINL